MTHRLFRDRHVVPIRLLAYSMLELLIAMALLSVLLVVAWSLLATYRNAEQRGWNLSQRTQTVRVIRQWLEQDLMQIAVAERSFSGLVSEPVASGELDNFANGTNSIENGDQDAIPHFVGNPQGFSTMVHASIDPLPFLEQLLRSAGSGSGIERQVADESELSNNSLDIESSAGPWPSGPVTVEYRLKPMQQHESSASPGTQSRNVKPNEQQPESWFLVRTERTELRNAMNVQSESGLEASLEPSERTLTAQDLYRQSDEQLASNPLVLQESTVPGLSQVRFAYWDGTQWKAGWNSQSEGRLPLAVSLTLNLSPERTRFLRSESSAEIESDFAYDSPAGDESFVGLDSQADESFGDGIGNAQQLPNDARIVVRLGQASRSARRQAL